MPTPNDAIRGGEFLIRKTAASDIFIPEEWSEEQLMMKQMISTIIVGMSI